MLAILQREDPHGCHTVLAGGRSKRAAHVNQVHGMAGVHGRWAHVPERLRRRVEHNDPVVDSHGVQVQAAIEKDRRAKEVPAPPPQCPRVNRPRSAGSDGDDAVLNWTVHIRREV